MIAYEDLDKALARWKARRSGTGEAPDPTGDVDVPGMVVETVETLVSFEARDSTGELDLGDAVLDEA